MNIGSSIRAARKLRNDRSRDFQSASHLRAGLRLHTQLTAPGLTYSNENVRFAVDVTQRDILLTRLGHGRKAACR